MINPEHPDFKQLVVVQDEDGGVLRRVANVFEWVNVLAYRDLSKQADRLLPSQSVPPIDKARAKADAFKTIGAVDRSIIRTEDTSKSSTFEAAKAKAHRDLVLKSRPLINPSTSTAASGRSPTRSNSQNRRQHSSSNSPRRYSHLSKSGSRQRKDGRVTRGREMAHSPRTYSPVPSDLQDYHHKSPTRLHYRARSSSRYRSRSPHAAFSRGAQRNSYLRTPSGHHRQRRERSESRRNLAPRRRFHSRSRSRSRSPLPRRERHRHPSRHFRDALDTIPSRDSSRSPKSVIISRPRKD
jgi:hypothetical protein